MTLDDWLYCPECADVRAVEIPECPDGHGRHCPERACVECGSALLVAVELTPTSRRRPAHAA